MSNNRFFFISLILIFSCSFLFGQIAQEKITLINALKTISLKHNVSFNYDSKSIAGLEINPIPEHKTLEETLAILNTIPQLKFTRISDYIVVIEKLKAKKNTTSKSNIEQLSTVNLTGYLVKGITKNESGVITINHSKFNILPGVIETDVLQTLKALPGIQSIDETVSNINIRGGSNDQNLILWDDIKMYQTGHFFGLISSFNPLITERTSLYKNGTDASYTDGVSGMIKMQTQQTINKKLKAVLGVNFLNASALIDIPTSKKSSLQIAGRKAISNLVKTPTYNTYFEKITQNTEVENNSSNTVNSNKSFDFYDASLRWLYAISKNDMLRVNFITTTNALKFEESAFLNTNLQQRESSLSQQSYAAGAFYKRNWNTKFTTTCQLYETDYILKAINANILDAQRLLQKNSVSETSVRLMGNYSFSDNLNWSNGYQFIESEISNLNDIDVPRFKELKSIVLRTHSVFSQIKQTSKNKTTQLKAGLRLNYLDKYNTFILEPRFGINRKLSPYFKMELLGEFKHQNASQIINFQNDFLGIEKRRWQLTNNGTIPIMKSKQLSLGNTFTKRGWLVDIDSYYKNVSGITTQSQGFSTKYEFEKTFGNYNVYGVDALVRKKYNNFNGWLSYSFMKNTYSFSTLEEQTFPSNFDITHTLNLGTTYALGQLKLSGGINIRTGQPTTTPVIESPILNDTINFNSANSSRLKTYIRTDFSALYNFKTAKNVTFETGISVWNLTNYNNITSQYYRIINDEVALFNQQSLKTSINLMFAVKI